MLGEVSESILSVCHILDLFSILALTMTAKLRDSGIAERIIKTSRIILALLVLCENELDVLAHVEIDINALCPEDRPPL